MKYEIKKDMSSSLYFLVKHVPCKKQQDNPLTASLEIVSMGTLEAVQSCYQLHAGANYNQEIKQAFMCMYPRKEIV